MNTLKFSELDAVQMRLVFSLADEAETLTPLILASASHIGELWEAKAFLKRFPRRSAQHSQLTDRLRLGSNAKESILKCIERIAPDYMTLGARILQSTEAIYVFQDGSILDDLAASLADSSRAAR